MDAKAEFKCGPRDHGWRPSTPDQKFSAGADDWPLGKAEAKVEAKAEAKIQAKAGAKVEEKAQAKADAKAESKTWADSTAGGHDNMTFAGNLQKRPVRRTSVVVRNASL